MLIDYSGLLGITDKASVILDQLPECCLDMSIEMPLGNTINISDCMSSPAGNQIGYLYRPSSRV